MSKATRSLRDYKPCNKTKLMDRLKISHPEMSLRNAKFNHGPLCASQRYFVACDCAVSVSVIDPVTGQTTTYS
jgi:hypothetical protein